MAALQKLLLASHGRELSGTDKSLVEEAVDKLHRKPRSKARSFASQQQREQSALESEVQAILPLLPREAAVSMLGGKGPDGVGVLGSEEIKEGEDALVGAHGQTAYFVVCVDHGGAFGKVGEEGAGEGRLAGRARVEEKEFGELED